MNFWMKWLDMEVMDGKAQMSFPMIIRLILLHMASKLNMH